MRKIMRGSEVTLTARIQKENGEPRDLTAATEITVRMKMRDGSTLTKTLTGLDVSIVGNALLGKISWDMTEAETTLLKSGGNDFVVLIDEGGSETPVNFENQLTALDQKA